MEAVDGGKGADLRCAGVADALRRSGALILFRVGGSSCRREEVLLNAHLTCRPRRSRVLSCGKQIS
jgi:hypothetical protein